MNKILLSLFIISVTVKLFCASQEYCDAGKNECMTSGFSGTRVCLNNNSYTRILLIGKTGVGKSSTGNLILGKKAFQAEISGESVTQKTQIGEAERFGKKLLVVDTPGLFDTNKENDEIIKEIKKCYAMTSPGLHAIVLVLEIGRFTDEDEKTLALFLNEFREKIVNYLVIVFTHKEKLRDGMSIHDFVETLRFDSILKKIINMISKRYTVFGYDGQKDERDAEVRNFLHIIDTIKDNNDGKFFTNDIYKELDSYYNRFLRHIGQGKENLSKEEQELKEYIEEIRKQNSNWNFDDLVPFLVEKGSDIALKTIISTSAPKIFKRLREFPTAMSEVKNILKEYLKEK